MRVVPLGDIIRKAPILRAGKQDAPILSMTMHDGLVDQRERFKKRIASTSTEDYRLVSRGQLVVGFPIDEGVLDFQLLHDEAMVSPAYGIWDLRQPEKVDPTYLRRFLRSPTALAYYSARLRGSTARRRSLPAESFLALSIPLPGIEDQRRIAAILDRADALRAKRRQVRSHLSTLSSSRFAESFGTNHYPLVTLDKLSHGGEYGAAVASREFKSDLPRYVRITDIADDGTLNGDPKSPAGDRSKWSRYLLKDGDFLFARSGATVGKTYRYSANDGPCIFAGYLIRYRLNQDLIDPRYLSVFTTTSPYKAWVKARQNVVAQPNINAKQYGSELHIPLPPISEQRAFTAVVDAIDLRRKSVESALAKDDELFASLQSRAFKGEL